MQRSRLTIVLVLAFCVPVLLVAVLVVLVLRDGPAGEPSGLDGTGGTVAWSMVTKSGSRDAAVAGDTAVILDGTSLVGVSAADGSRRWVLPYPGEDATFTVADGRVAVQKSTDGPVDVVDPASGRIVWSVPQATQLVARQDALYLDSCPDRGVLDDGCVTVKRRVTDGTVLWSVTDPAFALQGDVIGGRRPLAPPASERLPVTTTAGGALLDTATGRLLPGRLEDTSWHLVAAGNTLAATDHDPPRGDRDCTVTVAAVDGRTGRPAWNGRIYSGRENDGECEKSFGRLGAGGHVLLGSGSGVAAVNRAGATTLTDFATGELRWTAELRGAPIAGDDRALLVRDNAESGPVGLLDMATGRRLWTAPDTGLPTSSASWDAAVAGDLAAVMGATGDRPYVLVFDSSTGRQLARRGGWLTGIGDGWVMVSTGVGVADGDLRLHMLTF